MFAFEGGPLPPRPQSASPIEIDSLQRRINTTWNDHAIAGQNRVDIISAHPGRWDSSICATPSLWIFLVGHYRTFTWTREKWKHLASHSSGCTMVVAFAPAAIDVPEVERRWWRKKDVGWRMVSTERDGVPALMERARQEFGNGRFAYVVVRRAGSVSTFPACLSLYWHGAWAAAHWVAAHSGISIDPSAVVLRARPDVALPLPLQLSRTQAYFKHGARGRHLMFGPGPDGQADVLMLTSFGAYSTDIAIPLQLSAGRPGAADVNPYVAKRASSPHAAHRPGRDVGERSELSSGSLRDSRRVDGATGEAAIHQAAIQSATQSATQSTRFWWERAHLNGWGYGRNVLNQGVWPSMHRCMDHCLCVRDGDFGVTAKRGTWRAASREQGGPRDGRLRDGGDMRRHGGDLGNCSVVSCMLTVVEGALVHSNRAIVRHAPKSAKSPPMKVLGAKEHLHHVLEHQAQHDARHERNGSEAGTWGDISQGDHQGGANRSHASLSQHVVRRVDPASSVRCYCAESAADAKRLHAARPYSPGSAGAVPSMFGASNGKAWGREVVYLRCDRGEPLVPLARQAPPARGTPTSLGGEIGIISSGCWHGQPCSGRRITHWVWTRLL